MKEHKPLYLLEQALGLDDIVLLISFTETPEARG